MTTKAVCHFHAQETRKTAPAVPKAESNDTAPGLHTKHANRKLAASQVNDHTDSIKDNSKTVQLMGGRKFQKNDVKRQLGSSTI